MEKTESNLIAWVTPENELQAEIYKDPLKAIKELRLQLNTPKLTLKQLYSMGFKLSHVTIEIKTTKILQHYNDAFFLEEKYLEERYYKRRLKRQENMAISRKKAHYSKTQRKLSLEQLADLKQKVQEGVIPKIKIAEMFGLSRAGLYLCLKY